MKNLRNYQGGWVASFVVVGVLLISALLGGVYYLKTHQGDSSGDLASDTDTVVVNENDSRRNNNEDKSKTDTGSGNDARVEKKPSANDKDSADSATEKSSPGGQSGTVVIPGGEDTNDTKSDNSQSQQPVVTDEQDDKKDDTVESADVLPQTGPGDDIMSFIAMGSVTFAGVVYLQSRRGL